MTIMMIMIMMMTMVIGDV